MVRRDDDRCAYPGCRREGILRWLTRWLCQHHWEWVCRRQQAGDTNETIKKALR